MLPSLKKCWLLLLALGAMTLCAAEKDFKMGVYIYDYAFKRIAASNGEDFKAFAERHLKLLSENGVNAIHLTVSDPTGKAFEEIWRPLLKKYRIKAYLQLDFAYFIPGKTGPINMKAVRLKKLVNLLQNTKVVRKLWRSPSAKKWLIKMSTEWLVIIRKSWNMLRI